MLAPVHNLLATERRRLDSMADIIEPWRRLAANAAEPNVFYEPAFALAAAEPAAALGRDVETILVWSAETPRRLIGLFPFRIEQRRYLVKFAVLTGWTHRFAPLGAPLIDRDASAHVVAAFLDHVASNDELPGLVLLPLIEESGPVAVALREVLAKRGGSRGNESNPDEFWAAFGRQSRAALKADGDRNGYLERALGAKRRKELRRQRRRLADSGDVAFSVVTAADEIASALEEFFAMEATGWKGRAGTAMVQHPGIRRFVEKAINGLAARDQIQVARFACGTRTIASVLVLRAGATAWSWKVAYHEGFAAASPGVQLFLDLTETLLADASIIAVDSCAVPDHPMIDHIWRERIPIADCLIATRPETSFALACRLEAARRSGAALARRMRGYLWRG
jgi:CelD/BcsL family acetyltransferase involved in cellulose biosynthesis